MKNKLGVLLLFFAIALSLFLLIQNRDNFIVVEATKGLRRIAASIDKPEQGIVEIVVRKGWTLAEIAEGVGMALKELVQLNNLTSYNIYPGRILRVKPYTAFDEVLVSWYGPKYHGRTMANGEIFNMYDPTVCAHKWLPFGTRVRLTRIDTGASIEVMVQDRGPYVANRHFDLSYSAAQKLDMVEEGVVLCKVEILDWPH